LAFVWKKFLLGIFLIVALSAGATATAGLLQVKDIVDAIKAPHAPSIGGQEVTQAPAGAPQTILVIGSDHRYGERGAHSSHSDTILLVRLNSQAKATAMLSIPRDLKVEVPGHGEDKINSAYAVGGPTLTAKVVKQVLSSPQRPFKINHIIDIDFSLFQRLVNRLGRVYVDVDRNYFHQNSGAFGDYSSIDIQPGYQLLSGSDALAYVRYRHTDTDIVRAARQQGFLRDAKDQYGTGKLISDRKELARLFGTYTRSDHGLKTETGLIKLLNLMIALASDPIVQVKFPAILGAADDPFVTADPAAVQTAVSRFLEASGVPAASTSKKKAKHHRRGRSSSTVAGMVSGKSAGEQQGLRLGAGVGLPVYYPKLIPMQARYMGPVATIYPRAYTIQGPLRHRYKAYRMVLDSGLGFGNYLGVEGTTWKDPPLLKKPSEVRRLNHRSLELFYDGHRLRVVAWRTPRGVYWVSNTLQELVPGRQMLAIAASLTRIGS
jgi:polyisoprenyl-teichoic acid--peptidoglycan teichoic acid transferase